MAGVKLRIGLLVAATVFMGALASYADGKEKLDLWFRFEVNPNTPLKDLLPVPPKSASLTGPLFRDNLADVPEIYLEDPNVVVVLPSNTKHQLPGFKDAHLKKNDFERIQKMYAGKLSDKEIEEKAWEYAREQEQARIKALERIAWQTARINFLSLKTPERFIELLMENRPDLAGLPFILGAACRQKNHERKEFSEAVALVRMSADGPEQTPKHFWECYDESRKIQREHAKAGHARIVCADRSCVAALMQRLAAESAPLRKSLAERLPSFDKSDEDKKEVTRALTRLAVFAPEAEVRRMATDLLRPRDTSPATEIIVRGLHYPWPSVATNAAELVAQLKRRDLAVELVNLLEEPEPRAPRLREIKGRNVSVVREVVRVNHLRNCLLCHPPGDWPGKDLELRERRLARGKLRDVAIEDVSLGAIPPPGHELPMEPAGYDFASARQTEIRADITYLRQDFSLLLKVPGAAPWPKLQRFDFMVRVRALSDAEAKAAHAEFAGGAATSLYRQAALSALRLLSGRDGGTTAGGWRAALGLKSNP